MVFEKIVKISKISMIHIIISLYINTRIEKHLSEISQNLEYFLNVKYISL